MKRFIEGLDRSQTSLLWECVDAYVDEDNPVRAVDAFVDMLDLGDIGPAPRHALGLPLESPAAEAGEIPRLPIRNPLFLS
jgi:transposase